jgi:Flp pilus assembly protein TadG
MKALRAWRAWSVSGVRAAGRRLGDECGQVVAVTTLGMLALLGIAALVLDIGHLAAERRQLQSAVDGAALAAARYLPDSEALALDAAEEYLTRNGVDLAAAEVTVSLTPQYGGDPDRFGVTVGREVDLWFGPVVGLFFGNVTADAAAEVVTTFNDAYAIFAIGDDCGATAQIDTFGSDSVFSGVVHSNGGVDFGGNSHTVDPAITYACDLTVGGSGHSIGDEKHVGTRPSPINMAYADFAPCDYTYNKPNVNLKAEAGAWQDGARTILKDGVHCFNGRVSLVGDGITGDVTLAAKNSVDISGSGHQLRAYHPSGVLVFSGAGGTAIDASGSGGIWEGTLYAPNGLVDVTGNGGQIVEGSLIGDSVAVAGGGLSIVASDVTASNGNPVVRLIQ